MNKIIGLDFDGVLNDDGNGSFVVWPDNTRANVFIPGPDVRPAIFPAQAACLQNILQATGARIVVTSSWRSYLSLSQVEQWLRERGVSSAVVVGRTSLKDENGVARFGWTRDRYVREWVLNHASEGNRFVAIDDDESITKLDYGYEVNTLTGLTEEDVPKIINMLNN